MAKLSRPKQNELILAESKRLYAVFDKLSEDKKVVAKDLIDKVAFMSVQLKVLEEHIKLRGPTYLMKNGTQEMYVENPSQKSYNTMINRYTTALNKLFSLIDEIEDDGNGFAEV